MKTKINIFMEDCVLDDNNIYFFAQDFNGLCKVDLSSDSIQLISRMPREHILAYRLCGKLIKVRNLLVVVPFNARHIQTYNLDTNEWDIISENEFKPFEDLKKKFCQAILWKDVLYMIGIEFPGIVKWDTKTNEISIDKNVYSPIKSEWVVESQGYFRKDFCICKNSLYLPCLAGPFILKYHLDEQEYEWIRITEEHVKLSGITFDGNKFWIAPRFGNCIYMWDEDKQDLEIVINENDLDVSKRVFINCTYWNDLVYMPSSMGGLSLVYDCKSKVFSESVMYKMFEVKDRETLITQDADGWLKIITARESKCIKCEMDRESVFDNISCLKGTYPLKMIPSNGEIYENCFRRLEIFIQDVMREGE